VAAHRTLQYCGAGILAAGLIAAILIYAFEPADSGADLASDIAHGRLYEYNIERIGGMSAVYAARFNDWLFSLWHGRALAGTTAVLATVAALGCFGAARLARRAQAAAQDAGYGSGEIPLPPADTEGRRVP